MVNQEEIQKQCLNDDPEQRKKALEQLRSVFSSLPDKQKAWDTLVNLTNDEKLFIRRSATLSLGPVFPYLQNKQQAWNDLVKLTQDEKRYERVEATYSLFYAFSHVPDKQQAWEDLRRLFRDQDERVRDEAALALRSEFSHVPNKQQAWNDLIKLTNDEDDRVRHRAASAFGSAFPHMFDKQQAWNGLHKLTNNYDEQVRSGAAYSLGFAFSHVPDKQQAWEDLRRLLRDPDKDVRCEATDALGSAFSHVPDKQQAWNDLIELTNDKYRFVNYEAVSSLGSAFPYVSDKKQAWDVLYKLTNDERSVVRAYANHSLGKVSIFQASQAENEEDYKKELENAIHFFENASKESKLYNPAQFCLPFYRSFHTIIFKKQEAKEEVDKYLEEAKCSIKHSKSKEILFEAIDNLANALKEVQNLNNMELQAKKGELKFYRQYCDRAANLMRYTEDIAPYATITMRKGLPILDRSLKELLEEIQERAKSTYKHSKGTVTEDIAYSVCREVQKWEIGSQEYLKMQINNLVDLLKFYIPKTQENISIISKTDIILQESDIVKQYMLLNNLIPQIIDIQVTRKTDLALKELQELRYSVDKLVTSIDELQNPLKYIAVIQRDLEEIKDDIPEMKGKIEEVLYELYSPLSTTQKLKVAIPLIPMLASYEIETDVPKLVADKIYELKNLILQKK